MRNVTNEIMEKNRHYIAKGNQTKMPGDNWGIAKLSTLVKLPNEKADGNNQHAAFLETGLPEEN